MITFTWRYLFVPALIWLHNIKQKCCGLLCLFCHYLKKQSPTKSSLCGGIYHRFRRAQLNFLLTTPERSSKSQAALCAVISYIRAKQLGWHSRNTPHGHIYRFIIAILLIAFTETTREKCAFNRLSRAWREMIYLMKAESVRHVHFERKL